MKKILISALKQILFFLLFFVFCRLIMILAGLGMASKEDAGFIELLKSFYFGFKLDLATTAYVMALPLLLLFLQSIWQIKIFSIINKYYVLIFIILYSFLTVGEIGLYPEWQTKMGYKALLYLKHPDEIFNTVPLAYFLIYILSVGIIAVGVFWVFNKYFTVHIDKFKLNILYSILFLIISTPLVIVTARGGLNPIPINQSEAYYSESKFANSVAINNAFNIIVSISENINIGENNPFVYFDDKQAQERVQNLYMPVKDTTLNILKTDHPNIVLIILESWSADLIESLGGDPGITPNFKKLESEGILFSNIYSNGLRSEQGMASIFSAFPSIPFTHIISQPEKASKLPSMVKSLKNKGYYTTFNFGGQLRYGNIKGFLVSSGFDNIKEQRDHKGKYPEGKLGIHDHYLFEEFVNDLNSSKQPFFSVAYTLSSHSPYDEPKIVDLPWDKDEAPYVKSAHYSDYALGKFFESSKKQAWYDNTIFILIADHSHHSYKNRFWASNDVQKIPLLICGGALKEEFKNTKIDKIGTNSDIPATVLGMLNFPHNEFVMSKNLLNPYVKDFAYRSMDEGGLGWQASEGSYVWSAKQDNYIVLDLPDKDRDSIISDGKSFLQVAFKSYLDY